MGRRLGCERLLSFNIVQEIFQRLLKWRSLHKREVAQDPFDPAELRPGKIASLCVTSTAGVEREQENALPEASFSNGRLLNGPMNRHESSRHSRAVQNAFAQTLLAKACH